ncbi:Annexin A9 [Apodemus speciosus]|uniref:Annexin n=1 Tax=Apodemus speciosus TaxID=105296 RepID=A0ABQ0EM12_APOSI
MSESCGPLGTSLTQDILSSLGLADKTAAWGTLGALRTFLSFSVDKDVQRLLKAIAGQGSLCSPGCPGTHSVDQAGLKLQRSACLCLPSAGTKGVDYGTIVDVLTNRSREQRQLISRAFQERTKQDLLTSLRAALSGDLEKIVVALLQPAAQFDAQELRTALKTSGSAEDVALEILATRAAPRLQACLAVYKRDFQVEAEEDIRTETDGILQDLLLALSKGGRENYSGVIDYNLEEQDVQALQQTGGSSTAGQWVLLFTRRSPEHLARVFDQYRRCTGQDLEDAIRNCFHGDAQLALISLASMMRNTALYFANKLHRALQETEPNFQVLMRVLISRSESDLLSIRAEYKKKFGKSLYSSLQLMQSEGNVVQPCCPCVELRTSETFLTYPDVTFKSLRFPYLVEHMEEPQGTPYTLTSS